MTQPILANQGGEHLLRRSGAPAGPIPTSGPEGRENVRGRLPELGPRA
jgi:hypothetical protein